MHAFGASHTGGDGSQDENAFQSFTENENADVEERHGWARVRAHRIWCAVCAKSLPNEHGDHKKRRYDNADAHSRLHLRLKFITGTRLLLPIDCFFLAAACWREILWLPIASLKCSGLLRKLGNYRRLSLPRERGGEGGRKRSHVSTARPSCAVGRRATPCAPLCELRVLQPWTLLLLRRLVNIASG